MNAKRLYLSLALSLMLALATGLAAIAVAQGATTPEATTPGRPDAPLGTAFTYQGRLTDPSGHPIDNTCDLQFTLWDDPDGGAQVGPLLNPTGLVVTGGLFTVQLDFGDIFDGTALWLKIAVQCAGDPGFTDLSPRQPLTAAPSALYAATAPWSGLTGVPPGFADNVDDDTTYAAGPGLVLTGTTFAADTGYLDARYTLIGHTHPGSDITSPVAEAISATWATTATYSLAAGDADTLDGQHAGAFALASHDHDALYWSLSGNAGTIPGIHFLGTTDAVSLTLAVSGTAALRLYPNTGSPNLVGGYSGNWVTPGMEGATIGGGGAPPDDFGTPGSNRVTYHFGTVAGGVANIAGGWSATVGGGDFNEASYQWATVGGGAGNKATGLAATICGGDWSTASGQHTTVCGGAYNTASAENATVGGGYWNTASGSAATVAGGEGNISSNMYTTVGGGETNTAGGAFATVGGGYDNGAYFNYGTIGGGQSNRSGGYATVGGGAFNEASNGTDDGYGAIGGGMHNLAIDNYCTVGGGGNNQAGSDDGDPTTAQFATVAGGQDNVAGNWYSTVGGGYGNLADSESATVAGGNVNHAADNYCTVGGGGNNQAGSGDGDPASSEYATIAGGTGNIASGHLATISGGNINTASGLSTVISGGSVNVASGPWATVSGGEVNTASGENATIAGGWRNVASGHLATISGGEGNQVAGQNATIGGGRESTAPAFYATVAGGDRNQANGEHAAIGGGVLNTVTGSAATIGGGAGNTAGGAGSTIGGGDGNQAGGSHSTVGGGYLNRADGYVATVAGGQSNQAIGSLASVAGGLANVASDESAAIAGGRENQAGGYGSFVGGGYMNIANGQMAVIAGGGGNTASGELAMVPGGSNNFAGADYAFAAGHWARAVHSGAFVWGDSTDADVRSSGNDQFIVRANGGLWFGQATTAITPTITYPRFINTSTGAYLSVGGTWTNASDRNLKEDLTLVDRGEVLARLSEVPISTWNYRAEDPSVRHMGPTAQDFYAAFGLGNGDTSIGTVDADGVALAAIQGLYAENQALKAENAARQAQIDDLAARLTALEQGSARHPRRSPSGDDMQGRSRLRSGGSLLSSYLPWLFCGGLVMIGGVVTVRRKRGQP